MGKPIRKKWFGDPASAGAQLTIRAKLPDLAVADGFIIAQKGTRKYLVDVGGETGMVYLKNTTSDGDLEDGEAFMTATPFGGAESPISKLTQFRVTVWNADDSISSYSWSQAAAENPGEATVITDSIGVPDTATATIDTMVGGIDPGSIATIAIVKAGAEYTSAPTVTVNSATGSGAVITATIANGSVDSITVNDGGIDYNKNDTITISSP